LKGDRILGLGVEVVVDWGLGIEVVVNWVRLKHEMTEKVELFSTQETFFF